LTPFDALQQKQQQATPTPPETTPIPSPGSSRRAQALAKINQHIRETPKLIRDNAEQLAAIETTRSLGRPLSASTRTVSTTSSQRVVAPRKSTPASATPLLDELDAKEQAIREAHQQAYV
jgi:hypothetical protein